MPIPIFQPGRGILLLQTQGGGTPHPLAAAGQPLMANSVNQRVHTLPRGSCILPRRVGLHIAAQTPPPATL